MKVAGIFINYKTAELTFEAVEALLEELSHLGSHHVFVVDNDSQDGSFDYLSQAVRSHGLGERVTVIAAPRNGGYGYGINLAARHALAGADAPEYCYVLNTDAFVDPGSLSNMLDFMDAHPGVGLAGNRVHDELGVTQGAAFRFPSALGELEESAKLGLVSALLTRHSIAMPPPPGPLEVDWVPGTSMLIRRAVFEGGVWFDEDFFLYFEEVDFAQQVKAAGWEVYTVGDASVSHIGSVSTGLSDQKKALPDYWFDSRFRYYEKHHGARYVLACDAARATGHLLYFGKCLLQRKPYDERPGMLGGMLRAGLRFRLRPERPAAELGLLELLFEDFTTHDESLIEPGFWAVSIHRLGTRASKLRSPLLRTSLAAPAKTLATAVDWLWKIHIPADTRLGRRVRIWHGGGILLAARVIGDDVKIHHDTTLGALRGHDTGLESLPVIEDEVEIHSGAAVLGAITVGRGAVVHSNSTVLRNVPMHAAVMGVPAKILEGASPSVASPGATAPSVGLGPSTGEKTTT